MAWYASFGEQILGKLDPRTGKVTEYPIPLLKPGAPTGILGMRFDKDENPWLGDAIPGRHREVRSQDGEVPDLEPAAGTERSARADQPGEPGTIARRRQGVAAGCRHVHGPAPRYRLRQVRSVRAVQDSASERLRRDSRLEEQRVLPGAGGRGSRPHRRQDRKDRRSSRRRRRARDRAAG